SERGARREEGVDRRSERLPELSCFCNPRNHGSRRRRLRREARRVRLDPLPRVRVRTRPVHQPLRGGVPPLPDLRRPLQDPDFIPTAQQRQNDEAEAELEAARTELLTALGNDEDPPAPPTANGALNDGYRPVRRRSETEAALAKLAALEESPEARPSVEKYTSKCFQSSSALAPPACAGAAGARTSQRRVSYAGSVNSASTGTGNVTRASGGTFGSATTSSTRRGSMASMDGIWNRIARKSEVWGADDDISDLDSEEYKERGGAMRRWGIRCKVNLEKQGRWLKSTLTTAFKTPSIYVPCLVLFVAFSVAGMLIVYGFDVAAQNSRKQTATAVAEQTDLFFVRVLENAFVPLFTMAQFVHELPIFHELDLKIGDRCDPKEDEFNCTQSRSVPVMPGKEGTHRDVSKLFQTPWGQDISHKFDSIASGIKENSGLGKSLVNIQLAPKGVVSMLHPMVNCRDFDDGYCMNNTGAWGHDLLHDPNRVGIARATVPAESVVTAGPLKLIQGEDTFIARLPINMPDEGGHSMVVDGIEYPCWGFAVVLLNWKTLKEESRIYEEFEAEKMQFKLTRTDVKNGEEKVVTIAESKRPELIAEDNVTLALDAGDNGWVIAVGYDDGFSPNYKVWAFPIVFISAFVFAALTMLVLVSKKEHERLLLSLMPPHAIRKLRRGETVVERYAMATVFFSDIVGYTKMSSEMTPTEVMAMLGQLYSKFDVLAKKHKIYKVETIGDAYVAIAGAPKRCTGPEAAEKMTLFALDALQIVKDFRKSDDGAQIAIRVGLATGPVVAGVIGSSLPKYTLFGDTVNFAARMEQTGKKMRLQISPVTHRMLLDAPSHEFDYEERYDDDGELGIECKGKGRQYTFWVTSARKREPSNRRGSDASEPTFVAKNRRSSSGDGGDPEAMDIDETARLESAADRV
ncbi:hypothetical protein ACHAWF_010418, partial [Thalassiosira exigua]